MFGDLTASGRYLACFIYLFAWVKPKPGVIFQSTGTYFIFNFSFADANTVAVSWLQPFQVLAKNLF